MKPRTKDRASLIWKIICVGGGSVLIFIGIIGFFVPGMPQFVFIIGGLALMAPYVRCARWLLVKLKLLARWFKQKILPKIDQKFPWFGVVRGWIGPKTSWIKEKIFSIFRKKGPSL